MGARRVRTAVGAAAVAAAVATSVNGCALTGTDVGATTATATSAYAYVAMAVGRNITVHRSPSGPVLTKLANPNTFNDPLVLLATARSADWVKVLLPVRPNGSVGWVPMSSVRLAWDPWRVVVHLHSHQLALYDAGHPVYRTRVAVGSDLTPTPRGTFYITTLLRQPNPNDAYGPYAFGLSGYSPVLKHFAGGPGEIGLHGTDEPASIGHSVTHGCIRVSNKVITMLAGRLPLGTPVVVTR
jgi:lipoprotein-anchoring transpeptidase ErfK/SrfK